MHVHGSRPHSCTTAPSRPSQRPGAASLRHTACSKRQHAAPSRRMQWRRAPVPLPHAFRTVHIGPHDSIALHPFTSAGRGLEPLKRLKADADESESKTSHVTRIMKDEAPVCRSRSLTWFAWSKQLGSDMHSFCGNATASASQNRDVQYTRRRFTET
jgi:hypothetical protein